MALRKLCLEFWVLCGLLLGSPDVTEAVASPLPPTFVFPSPNFSVLLRNGPLRADAKKLYMQIEPSLLQKFLQKQSQPYISDAFSAYYVERRGLRDAKLIIEVAYADGSKKEFPIVLTTTPQSKYQFELKSQVKNLTWKLYGVQDYFKCFSPDVCTFVESKASTDHISKDESVKVQEFDPILLCADRAVSVEKKIGQPDVQRIVFAESTHANFLETSLNVVGRGQAAHDADSFVGFEAPVRTYQNSTEAFRTAHVFPESGGLKVKVDTKPFFLCSYQYSYGDNSGHLFYDEAMPGKSCERHHRDNTGTFLAGTARGVEESYSKEWFFPHCEASK